MMQAEEILTRAKAGAQLPDGWVVFPLLRMKVAIAIVGWAFGIIMGLGLFGLVASAILPGNYQHGLALAFFSTILLGILLFIGLGSLWSLIIDARRIAEADKHIIVITPDDFVKQEGQKILHVPCISIRHVTARGTPPPDRSVPEESQVQQMAGVGENAASFFFGRKLVTAGAPHSGTSTLWKKRRTPTSLAFVDTRTEREVIVTSDTAFGDIFVIAALLKQHTAAVQKVFR